MTRNPLDIECVISKLDEGMAEDGTELGIRRALEASRDLDNLRYEQAALIVIGHLQEVHPELGGMDIHNQVMTTIDILEAEDRRETTGIIVRAFEYCEGNLRDQVSAGIAACREAGCSPEDAASILTEAVRSEDKFIVAELCKLELGDRSSLMPLLAEFHAVFKSDLVTEEDEFSVRPTLIREEVKEVLEALEEDDVDHIANELADLIYVTYGTALVYGIDLDEAVRAVHGSNMSKLDDDGRPIFREDGKVLKSSNYFLPDMSESTRLARGKPAGDDKSQEAS